MKRISILIFLLTFSIYSSGQSPFLDWAIANGTGFGEGYDVITDASGNSYTTGIFSSTVDFDPGPGTQNLSSSGGSYDVFIQKLDPNGNLLWVKKVGGSSNDYAKSISLDGSGNVLIAGYFQGSTDFDPGSGSNILTSNGQDDIFVLKLDPSGNFLWAKSIGDVNYDQGFGVDIDNSDNVYVTGVFRGTVDFDPGAGTANITSSGGNQDVFILMLDASGNYGWAKQLGSASQNTFVYDIATTSSGESHIVGAFFASTDFDPGAGTTNLTPVGSGDSYVLKLNASGNFMWAISSGGSSLDRGYGIAVDNSGNVVSTGYFQGTADFDPGVGSTNLVSNGGEDVFVQKLDPSGNLLWAHNIGGTNNDKAQSVTFDATGNVYTTGEFTGTVDFDPSIAIANLSSTSGNDLFVQKLDGNGNFIWATNNGGPNYVLSQAIDVDGSNNVFTTGRFNGTVDFDPGSGTFSLSSFTDNVFVQKLLQCTPTAPTPDVTNLPNLTDECSVSAPTAPTATSNCFGTITGTTTTSFPVNTPGTTTITWTYDDGNGNVATQDQDIVIADVTDPTASNPTSVNVQCIGDVPAVDITVVTDEADNCTGTPTVAHVSDLSDGNTCPEVITRTYSVTDDAGNSINVTQTITVNDDTNPTASSPTGISVECTADIPAPDPLVITDETDNCTAAPTVAFVSDASDGQTCPETITRTYSVTDDCNNSINVTQTITVEDVTDPVPDNATLSDITEECQSTPTAPTATDNCGTITATPDVTFPITTLGTTTVTWTYTDDCGNSAQQTQDVIITEIDNSVTVSGITITAAASGYSYQWVDCDNSNAPITGETGQSFTPTANGNYAVEITDGTCTVTSACEAITTVGVLENNFGSDISVYPNPTDGDININLGANYNNITVEVKSITGQLIQNNSYESANNIELNINGEAGLYLIKITSDQGESAILRIVKH
jgi:hypothetical protein